MSPWRRLWTQPAYKREESTTISKVKEQLALEAFDYAINKVRGRFREGLEGKKTAPDRLRAILDIMARYVTDPPVAGGCPVHNTAVDSSHTHPVLQARARAGMDELQQYIRRAVENGALIKESLCRTSMLRT